MTNAPLPIQVEIESHLAEAFATLEGAEQIAVVSAWSLQVEVIDHEGHVLIHTVRSNDLAIWKALGMVEMHAHLLRTSIEHRGDDQ